MAAEPENFAPYASIGSVLTVIDQLRAKGLPDHVTPKWLGQLGLSNAVHSRVLQTLHYLGLIDKDDKKTPEADRLRAATPDQYPGVLAETVMRAYLPIFTIIDPKDALDDQKLTNAFWACEPPAVRDRMATLFVGLLKEAQLIEGGPVPRGTRKGPQASRKSNDGAPGRNAQGAQHPPPPSFESNVTPRKQFSFGSQRDGQERNVQTDARLELLHTAVRQLPESGKWTEEKKKKWLLAIESCVDLLVEVVSEEETQASIPQRAIWRKRDGVDQPILVLGQLPDSPDGRTYLKIAGSSTGIPAEEVFAEE